MLTERQHAANIENAQHSTGPTSEEGKRISSMNACRHGLTGQTIVMPDEDMAAYNAFVERMVATFDVGDAVEQQLAVTWASFQWRINRAGAIEENMLAIGNINGAAANLQVEDDRVHVALANTKTFLKDSQQFARISLYSHRLVNQAEKVLKQLKALQAERKYRQQKELSEAVQLYKLYRHEGAAFDPKALGFVFSTAEIEAHIRRQLLKDPDFIAQEAARQRKKSA
jgi:hypothetical protein